MSTEAAATNAPPPPTAPQPLHLVVMGVSGSGKTTLAEGLAEHYRVPYAEADEFHPPENIAKMSAGTPLTDDDRWPWLRKLRDWMSEHTDRGEGTIVTCSALRRVYRDVLREARGRVVFLHVEGTEEAIAEWLSKRQGHFMPASLLPSQFATLEPLESDEVGVSIMNDATKRDLIDRATAFVDSLGVDHARVVGAAEDQGAES